MSAQTCHFRNAEAAVDHRSETGVPGGAQETRDRFMRLSKGCRPLPSWHER